MKCNRMSKLSAGFMVLMMALTALVVFPVGNVGQTPTGKNIYVPVGCGGIAVPNAWVNLTNVHSGAVMAAVFQTNSYVVTNAPPGYYRVDVVHNDYYDRLGVTEFRFDGFNDYTVNPPINLQAFPYKTNEWNITVRNSADSSPLYWAKVGFYSPTAKEFVTYGLTDPTGFVSLRMFNTSVMGDFELVIIKPSFVTYIEPVLVNANNVTTISLGASYQVSGFAIYSNGRPAIDAVSYLVNTNPATHPLKRVLKSYGSFVTFDAVNGNYNLVVDAPGANAYMQAVTVAGSSVALTIPNLPPQTQRTELVSIAFGADYGSFSLNVNTTWAYDNAYPGLMYNDMGSLRMQVDIALGDGNGVLSVGEVSAFYAKVNNYGTQYVSSNGLVLVNDTVFVSALTTTGFSMDLAAGSVASTDGVNYTYSCQYTAHTAIDVGAPKYVANLTAKYDTDLVNYSYAIAPDTDYELTHNSSTTRVNTTGYLSVLVDPSKVTGGGQEVVELWLELSVRPIAKAGFVTGQPYAYAVYEDLNVTRYYVSVGNETNLTVSGSSDPNGNPLTYTWNFGDGSGTVNTTNTTWPHTYAAASAARTVNLTVTDMAGLVNWSEVVVYCDNQKPRPDISVRNVTVNTTDNSIAIDQRQVVWFNGTLSADDAFAAGDGLGLIHHYEVEYGDGNVSSWVLWSANEKNVSHSYERSGPYTLVLNVTDVVGHWANTTMTIRVNDTSAPLVSFTAKNETWGSTLVESTLVHFDANDTTDNVDVRDNLYFSWDFGDGNWTNGTGAAGAWNVTHNYTKVGSYIVRLNVTDKSDNYQAQAKNVQIVSGPRPNMRIDTVYFDPEVFTEGKSGWIYVNMTNTGSANATQITLTFYYETASGTEKVIGTSTDITLNGTAVTLVQPGQQVQAKFSWSPGAKGTYTIKVNVTSSEQLQEHQYLMSGDKALKVNEAGWKKVALWGGVAAVIILVPLLLYLRGRWSKREKKGPRREKKEQKGGEEEL